MWMPLKVPVQFYEEGYLLPLDPYEAGKLPYFFFLMFDASRIKHF